MNVINANRKLVLGISGSAGAGKDTFCKILQRYIKVKRYSLADILKDEVKDDCIEKHGIDPTNCTRTQKESIRDYLVDYGKQRREETKGRYFIDKLNKKILNEDGEVKENIIITDIRYDEWFADEVYWIQEELKGFLVHVQRYKIIKNHLIEGNVPANKDEEENLPRLRAKRDFLINVETFYELNEYELHEKIAPLVKNFVETMKIEFRVKHLRIPLH